VGSALRDQKNNFPEAVAHRVKVQEFEGPLDLLLDLIEQEKLDITKISLAKIAEDYLAEVKRLEQIKVESLVDFLVIASQLLVIKSRALLPLVEQQEKSESADELALRLAELKKFREAAELLAHELESKQLSVAREPLVKQIFYPPPGLGPADIERAFNDIIAQLPAAELLEEEVVEEVVSLEQKLKTVQQNLQKVSDTSFGKLAGSAGKTEIIITFLAILELLKQRVVSVDQDQLFGEITISTRGEEK